MRILLLLFLISTHAFTQKKDTLYIVYLEEEDRTDNYYEKHIRRKYLKKYLYRKNVWVFFSGFSSFVYDAKKHPKKALTKEYFLKLCVKNKSRVMYELVADTIVNDKGDTIDIDKRILIEIGDESLEMVYPKPKGSVVLNEKGEEQVNFDPPPFYYHYIQSFKVYIIEITKEGRYFMYEVDWIFGFPTE